MSYKYYYCDSPCARITLVYGLYVVSAIVNIHFVHYSVLLSAYSCVYNVRRDGYRAVYANITPVCTHSRPNGVDIAKPGGKHLPIVVKTADWGVEYSCWFSAPVVWFSAGSAPVSNTLRRRSRISTNIIYTYVWSQYKSILFYWYILNFGGVLCLWLLNIYVLTLFLLFSVNFDC